MKSVLKQSAIKLYNTYENVLFYSSIMVAVKPLHLYTEHRRHKYINQLFFWDWYAQNGMARLFWKGIQTLFMKEAFQLNSRMDCYCSKLAKLYGVPQRHSIREMFSFHRKVYFGLIDIYEFKQFQFCPRSTCDINVACLQLDKSQVLTFYDGGFRNWVYTRKRRCWCMHCTVVHVRMHPRCDLT